MSVRTLIPVSDVGDAWRTAITAAQFGHIVDCFFVVAGADAATADGDPAPVLLRAPHEFEDDHRAFVRTLVEDVCRRPDDHTFAVTGEGAALHYVDVLSALVTLYARHRRNVVLYLVDPNHTPTGIPMAPAWKQFAADHRSISAQMLVAHAHRLVGVTRV